jgi:hypothetical protein
VAEKLENLDYVVIERLVHAPGGKWPLLTLRRRVSFLVSVCLGPRVAGSFFVHVEGQYDRLAQCRGRIKIGMDKGSPTTVGS